MADASLFFEHNGKLVGPFSAEEVIERVHNGALGVSSKIFDAAKDVWITAADVVPPLNFNKPNEWRPPGRPADLTNVHVVDLNKRRTEGIDYFALISDRRREMQKERSSRQGKESQSSGSQNWAAPKLLTRAAASEITRTLKKFFRKARNTDTSSGPKTNGDATNNVFSFARMREVLRENQREFLVAASLALVFGGTFAVVKNFSSENIQREPATATSKPAPSKAPQTYSATKTEEVGKGTTPSRRKSGSAGAFAPAPVENQIAPLAAPVTPPPAPVQQAQEDGPLYYNSAEDQPQYPPVTDNTQSTPGDYGAEPGMQPPAPDNVPMADGSYPTNGNPPASEDPANMQAVTNGSTPEYQQNVDAQLQQQYDDPNRYPTSDNSDTVVVEENPGTTDYGH